MKRSHISRTLMSAALVATLSFAISSCGEEEKPKPQPVIGCTGDADCTVGQACDLATGQCVGCTSNADCDAGAGEICDTTDGTCVGVTCAGTADCPVELPMCEFASDQATQGSCMAYTACINDDEAEDGDDGPIGATDATPAAGASITISARKICNAPNYREEDWYRITVSDGDHVTVRATATAGAPDLDLQLFDSDGFELARGWWQAPETVTATYLPAGDIFAVVALYTDSVTTTTAAYELTVQRTGGNACTSVDDCAAEFATQYFRGNCNSATGACEYITVTGQGDGAVCDSWDDCASEWCSTTEVADTSTDRVSMTFTADASSRSFCTDACVNDTECVDGTICSTNFATGFGNYCVLPCTASDQCPVLMFTLPASGSWEHLMCDVPTGTCTPQVIPGVVANNQTLDIGTPDQIVVVQVRSEGPGWLVIHEENAGSPGTVIGNTAVFSGTNNNVTVQLSRAVVDGETLYAMLHVDAGVLGTFEPSTTDVAVTGAGGPVTSSFVVSMPTPSVTANNQTVSFGATQVLIAEAVSFGPGWVVVHSDNAGSPGTVLGQTGLADGVNTAVVVDLSGPVVGGETLHAMLRIDAGTLDTFEPGGADTEVLDGGSQPVGASFVVSVPEQSITVNGQNLTPPGRSVTVAEAISSGPGWVVIHEDTAGSPGTILGNTAVTQGTNTGVMVSINRDAVDGETLHAMLHVDAGTLDTFEPTGADVAATNTNGTVVISFVVSVMTPSVTVVSQTLADLTTRVTVDQAELAGPGWIVMHDAAGATGNIVGHAALTDGINNAVVVDLDRRAIDAETLYATLYSDAGTLGTFEPGGADMPVLDGSSAVIGPALTVTVPAGLPDVRLTATNQTFTSYVFTSVEPATMASTLGAGSSNQALNFNLGWRYSVVNQAALGHPFELLTIGSSPPTDDAIQLSQSITGTLEGDSTIAWSELSTQEVQFTASSSFAAAVDGYRCSVHTATMRGAVTVQ